MDGDAIQKDMTGAMGTPPINNAAITGITPQEHTVARIIDTSGFLLRALLINFDTLVSLTATASGIVIIR
jgi:hypothetical protein